MKNKRLWKRAKARGGFTLVELIVVIAILGILGGVGAVSYNGYVQRANEAADAVLLDSVNSAFAAACLTDHKDAVKVPASDISLSGGTLGEQAPTGNSVIDEAFVKYTADISGSAWKYYTVLKYKDGVYQGYKDGAVALSIAQKALVNTFNQSSFNGHETELAVAVDGVTSAFSGFVDALWGTGGAYGELTTKDDWLDSGEEFKNFMAELGITEDNQTDAAVANALVLYSASKAAGLDENGASFCYDLLAGNGGNENDIGGILPMMALQYGVLTAYAKSDYASDAAKEMYNSCDLSAMDPADAATVILSLGSAIEECEMYGIIYDPITYEPIGYVGGDESNPQTNLKYCEYYGYDPDTWESTTDDPPVLSDIEGYLATLQILNDYNGEIDVFDSNAFSNDDTLALLQAILAG